MGLNQNESYSNNDGCCLPLFCVIYPHQTWPFSCKISHSFLFYTPPPDSPIYFLCLHLIKTLHVSLWLCIYLSYSHLRAIVLLTVRICNKIQSQWPQNCTLEKMCLGETGQSNRLHLGWWPSWKHTGGFLTLIILPQTASPAARFTQKFKHQLCPQNTTWFCFAGLPVKLQSLNEVGNWSTQCYR